MTRKQSERIGVIVANLGSPADQTTPAVRRYLRQFLSDKRVIEVPKLIWWPVLNGIILTTRPKKSAEAYEKVWTTKGAPLIVYSQQLVDKLNHQANDQIEYISAMRYGNPNLAQALNMLNEKGIERILLIPHYPQYSATTTASITDHVFDLLKKQRNIPELRYIKSYFDDERYITTIADSIKHYREQHGSAEKLLISFHGIPKQYSDKGDPYHSQCLRTGNAIAEALGLNKKEFAITFQSRLGPKKWLQPYTDMQLKKWGKKGVSSVQVVCPGFSIDCLETLEEIAMENQELFIEAGGQSLSLIPCLNDSDRHVELIAHLVEKYTQDWRN